MTGRFDDRVVLIADATAGIGCATAPSFARDGATVALADVDGGRTA